jgi:hypothetical protein
MTAPPKNASLTVRPSRPVRGMLSALGHFVYRRRRLVLLGWAVLFVVGIAVGGGVFSFNVDRGAEPGR